MVHLTDGVVRRYLDEPASVSDAERAHLAGCRRCEVEALAAGHDRAAAALVLGATSGLGAASGPPDVDRAWADLTGRLGDATVVPVTRIGSARTPRLRHPVAAGVAAGLLVIGGTAAAAAADWLPIFRTETVAPVTVSMADVSQLSALGGMSGLEDYGDLSPGAPPRVTKVADAAAAERRTGLALPEVGPLPAGVAGEPTYFVVDQQAATFTVDAAKARAAAGNLPAVPKGLDGAELKLDAGPGVAQAWLRGSTTGAPTLLVARAAAPTVSSRGASLEQVRDYLLSIPGIPADLARQLRTMSVDGTLPIPVLTGAMSSSTTSVGGAPATVVTGGSDLTGGSGEVKAVVWVRNGQLDVVLGTLPAPELVRVANGLR